MTGTLFCFRWPIRLLVAIYAGWLAFGIFPISPIEGDEQGVINGATALARGENAFTNLAYLPAIQPGAYTLLARANRWTDISVENLFAVATAIGATLCVGFAALLLSRILGQPLWIGVTALLWCQEVSAAAYYLNTTAMGMWLTFVALWLATRSPTWRTCVGMSVCLALAGWIRIDCLLPAPAIAVLLYGATNQLRTAIRATALTAAVSLVLVSLLYHASGVTWETIASIYSARGAIEGWWPTFRALPLLLSPLLCALLAVGAARLLILREWRLLALIFAGCVATLPIYGTSLASTKYFYHLVPFLLLAVLSGAEWLRKIITLLPRYFRFVAIAVAAMLLVADQAMTLRTSSSAFRRYTPRPTLATLATFAGRERPRQLVVGAGEFIPTTDGFRLRGGALFAPLAWHQEKTAMQDQLARFSGILRSSENVTVYYSGWLPYQMIVRLLRTQGYQFVSPKLASNSMPYSGEWICERRRVHIAYLAYRTSEFFDASVHPKNETESNTYFIGDLSGVQPITELADAGEWIPLWPEHLWRAITVYQRRIARSFASP